MISLSASNNILIWIFALVYNYTTHRWRDWGLGPDSPAFSSVFSLPSYAAGKRLYEILLRLQKTLWYIILSKVIIHLHLYIPIHFKCKLSHSWFLKHINWGDTVSNCSHSACKYFRFFPNIRHKVSDIEENKHLGKQNLASDILVKWLLDGNQLGPTNKLWFINTQRKRPIYRSFLSN